MTLFALAVTAMWSLSGDPAPAVAPAATPLLGDLLTQFQTDHPAWAQLAAGIVLLITGMIVGRIAIRYNLYTVGTCLQIPLYGIVACGIFIGPRYLAGYLASMLLALATKNYCRAFRSGYSFDAIFRGSLYLGLLPLVYPPGAPLLLLLPLAVLIFHRTLREIAVAIAGASLPLLIACYLNWGIGGEFAAPAVTLAEIVLSGDFLQLFSSIPLPALVMLGALGMLLLGAFFLFLNDIYATGTKPRFILFYNIGILVLALGLLCCPATTPEAFALLAIPAGLLLPVLFVRIHRLIALCIYLLFLAAAFATAVLQ